jgi:cyclin T
MKSFGLLDDEDVANNPSVLDNIPMNKVLEHKRKSLTFVRKLGASLKLRLISISTAQVFLHRFYSRQSFKTHDRWIVATTCVFLASKVEEDVRKLEAVLFAHVEAREREKIDRDSEEYQTLREKVLLCERILLHTMGFDISVEHPHSEGLR